MVFLARISFLVAFAAAFCGCSTISYVAHVTRGQLALYNHERKLEDVLRDPRVKPEVRERIAWVSEIKGLVEGELGMKPTSNYTTYVQLDRPYVTWSLTVAEPYELKLKEWSFPLVGSFPYLGFFSEEKAKDWAAAAERDGKDTAVRGVGAYSTIGYLRDPLLSSMLSRRKRDLVNLVFHESMHGHVYLKGQGSFNEQIASYVGDYGEREWLRKTHGEASVELREWEDERADRREFGRMLRAFADQLKLFYKEAHAASLADSEKSARKEALFAELRRKVEAGPAVTGWRAKPGYARVAPRLTNNASLLAFLTYEDDQELMDLLHEKCGRSVKAAVRKLKLFGDEYKDRRAAAEKTAKPEGSGSLTPQALLREELLRSGC